MPEEVKLNEAKTHYVFPDAEVIRVTKVLEQYQEFSMVPAEDMEFGARRGTAVHYGTMLIDGAIPGAVIDYSKVEPEIEPYLRAYERFKGDSGFISQEVEKVVRSRKHGYAGTLDRIGIYEGAVTILDIKTGPLSPFERNQLAAYRQAHIEQSGGASGDISRHSVHLKADGNYDPMGPWENDDDDFRDFLVMLHLFRLLDRKRLLKDKTFSSAKPRPSWSREMLAELSTLQDEGLAAKIARFHELKALVSEHRALDKALKAHFEGNERTLIKGVESGWWLVEGEEKVTNYQEQPAKEARTTRTWRTTFTEIEDAEEPAPRNKPVVLIEDGGGGGLCE